MKSITEANHIKNNFVNMLPIKVPRYIFIMIPRVDQDLNHFLL